MVRIPGSVWRFRASWSKQDAGFTDWLTPFVIWPSSTPILFRLLSILQTPSTFVKLFRKSLKRKKHLRFSESYQVRKQGKTRETMVKWPWVFGSYQSTSAAFDNSPGLAIFDPSAWLRTQYRVFGFIGWPTSGQRVLSTELALRQFSDGLYEEVRMDKVKVCSLILDIGNPESIFKEGVPPGDNRELTACSEAIAQAVEFVISQKP